MNFRTFGSRINNTVYRVRNGGRGLRCSPRVPFRGMRKIGTGASSPGAGLVVSLAD